MKEFGQIKVVCPTCLETKFEHPEIFSDDDKAVCTGCGYTFTIGQAREAMVIKAREAVRKIFKMK